METAESDRKNKIKITEKNCKIEKTEKTDKTAIIEKNEKAERLEKTEKESQVGLKRFEIKEILNAEHIKSLKLNNIWPVKFKDLMFGTGVKVAEKVEGSDALGYEDDSMMYESEEEEDNEVRDRFGNTVSIEDEDDDEDEGQEEEGGEGGGEEGECVEIISELEKNDVEIMQKNTIITTTTTNSSNNNNSTDEPDEYEEEEEDDRNVEYTVEAEDDATLDLCCVTNWPTPDDVTCSLCSVDAPQPEPGTMK